MPRTLDEIRASGLEALEQRLGKAGMIRFLQQFTTGSGDYARDRHAWVDQTSLDQLRNPGSAKQKRVKRTPRKKA